MKTILALLISLPALLSACAPTYTEKPAEPDLFKPAPAAPDQASVYLQDPGMTVIPNPSGSTVIVASPSDRKHSFKSRTVLAQPGSAAPARLPSRVASGSDGPEVIRPSGGMMGGVAPGSLK